MKMKLLTIKEASEILKAKESTIRTWVNRKIIPETTYIKIGSSLRFIESNLEEWITNLFREQKNECV